MGLISSFIDSIISIICVIISCAVLAITGYFVIDFVTYLYQITPLWLLILLASILLFFAFGFFLVWYKEKTGHYFLGIKY